MPAGLDPVAAGLEPDQPDARVVEERVEDADRVRPAPDARRDRVGQPPGALLHLLTGLQPDHPVEVAHHRRERVRARDRAEQVVGGGDVGDPVAQRLVDRVLQRARPVRDRHDPGPSSRMSRDVERLAAGVDLAHVDDALEPDWIGH